MPPRASRPRRSAFTLVEVIVAMAILLGGVVVLLQLFPITLRANTEAELRTAAAFLAQQKVDEMRRDRDRDGTIIIPGISGNPETAPRVHPGDRRLAYSYAPGPAIADEPVVGPQAWIIIRASAEYDPAQPVLFQARFDE